MPQDQLEQIIQDLAGPQADQRDRARQARRSTQHHRATDAGNKDKLTPADRILATILYQRQIATQTVLGQLFSVDRATITRAVNETHPLLEQHGHTITPSTARFPAPHDLAAFLHTDTEAPTATKLAC